MELGKEKCGEATVLATQLECGFDGREIRLAEEEMAATAVNAILRTLKVLALCIQACFFNKSLLCKNCGHTLEDTGLQVPFWEVERL